MLHNDLIIDFMVHTLCFLFSNLNSKYSMDRTNLVDHDLIFLYSSLRFLNPHNSLIKFFMGTPTNCGHKRATLNTNWIMT